jgi:multiple sugar transport system substrate-binding protein
LQVGAGLSLAGTAVGCSTLSAGVAGTEVSPGTVTYWNLFGGGNGVRMETMEDAYRAGQGSPKLKRRPSRGHPYYTKLSLATIGNVPRSVSGYDERRD